MKRKQFITESTPSKSEYFSWINNRNEGSTEEATIANLDFFKFLKENYSMQLDIYAWDAGNLDGVGNSYETLDSPKIKKQFPNGYLPIVNKAKEIGIRMGVWGGPDGYGNTEEEAKKRHDLLVTLAKDYHFALFKFDEVCGSLRKDKREYFRWSMDDCREYAPDLILLNHRNDFGDENYQATTFLWEGLETYTDVHCYNKECCMHNRGYIFSRGYIPNLKRLTEDHGVCLSSSLDYFEDDLVYQAFNRSLILAPEIYGNPWFLRDDEYPILAHVFNLHRKYREILVNGFIPKGDFGSNPVIRGHNSQRIISTGNNSWFSKKIKFSIGEEIGYKEDKAAVIIRFPYEHFIGIFRQNDLVEIELLPFRAALIEIVEPSKMGRVLTNALYSVVKEDEFCRAQEVKVLKSLGEVQLMEDGDLTFNYGDLTVEDIENVPLEIANLDEKELPQNVEELYESIYFNLENECLERRCLDRSGDTHIPEVKKCREFFFAQSSYVLAGLDGNIPFDRNDKTIYDTKSVAYYNHEGRLGYRVKGGCLRADFGKNYSFDRIEIEYFDYEAKEPYYMFREQEIRDNMECSAYLKDWVKAKLQNVIDLGEYNQEVHAYYSDNYEIVRGKRKRAVFSANGSYRYFRMPRPIDRIYTIKIFKGSKEVLIENGRCNILFPAYKGNEPSRYLEKTYVLDTKNKNPFLSVCFNGYVGNENVVVGVIVDGKIHPAPRRAPEYPAEAYEYPVHPVEGNYTFYIPLKKEWLNKKIKVFALVGHSDKKINFLTNVFLCDGHMVHEGKTIKFNK